MNDSSHLWPKLDHYHAVGLSQINSFLWRQTFSQIYEPVNPNLIGSDIWNQAIEAFRKNS